MLPRNALRLKTERFSIKNTANFNELLRLTHTDVSWVDCSKLLLSLRRKTQRTTSTDTLENEKYQVKEKLEIFTLVLNVLFRK